MSDRRRRRRNGFSQKSPPFLIYLKNILRKYPDGGQILKELIQNADDAGASEVIFVYDERSYGTKTLWSEDLLAFQGPALLAYNNATFSDEDWKGIQSTGDSLKLKDPNTVGRFGLGFNSVYHITDLPGVFSSTNIGMLDPQRTAFDDGGFIWDLQDEEDSEEVKSLTDQFLPYSDVLSAIGHGGWGPSRTSSYFNGTLFRFPLRSCSSKISDNLYTAERVNELFECFSKDASISLLFLRNVTQISLKKIDCNGMVKDILTASVTFQGIGALEDINSTSTKLFTKRQVKVTSTTRPDRPVEVCKWLVLVSTVRDGSFQDLDKLSKKLNNIPTVGLAYSLSNEGDRSSGGRLSCFLPLPDREENTTGLPVLINASFDLTDDRRSIKWVEVDQQHDDAAQWNHLLVKAFLPVIYCQAVQTVVSLVKFSDSPVSSAYGIWPDPQKTKQKKRWHWLAEKLSQDLFNMEVLCMAADSTRWVKASNAVFIPPIKDGDMRNALKDLLLCVGKPLVEVPEHIVRELQLTCSNRGGINMVSPHSMREVLRQGTWGKLNRRQKLLLLEYIMSDGKYRELLGVQLLPLMDGTFISFLDTEHEGMALIDSQRYPRLLLPGLLARFVPTDLKTGILQQLQEIGEKKIFRNLVCLDKEVIWTNLPKALPGSWISGSEQVTWIPGVYNNPPREWLPAFWKFLQQDFNDLSTFEGYPLVPLNPMCNGSQQLQLARLKLKSSLLLQSKDGHSLQGESANMMETIGCTVLRQCDPNVWHRNLSKYIMAPTPCNIVKSFSNVGLSTVLRKLDAMPSAQKKMLIDLLSQASAFSTEEQNILNQLPVFCKMSSLQSAKPDLVAARNAQAVDQGTVPALPKNLVLPQILLVCRDEQDRRLLLLMGVQFLSSADVAILSVLAIRNGQYAQQQKMAEAIMLWVLRNGNILFSQNNELRKICEGLSFVPCNGGLVRPSALFDPHVTLFQELFDPQRFPPKDFQESEILKSLRTLGLKASMENITPGDVLQVAEDVSKKQAFAELQLRETRARALAKACNGTQVLSRFNSSNMQTLRKLAWVPCIDTASRLTFCKPQDVRSKQLSSLVEHSMPLTDIFNKESSKSLGLNDSPPAEKVIENLTVLSHQYCREDGYKTIMKLHNIYSHVQDNLSYYRNVLHSMMIWNSDGFSDPSEIVLSFPAGLDLNCHIKRVPENFLMYSKLFLECGVRQSISDVEIMSMLQQLMKDMQERTCGCGTKTELKMAISILDWMKRQRLITTDELPVPVYSTGGEFILKPLSTVLFCDMPKERLKDLAEDQKYNIVHDDITVSTATFLKLPLLSTKLLKPEYFEPWGPSEPITLRIKNILREYSEEVDLFKEMIQNADDAGATVCSFLVDLRQNLAFQNSLIDPDMGTCHGPALWAFNNSKFSEEDFRNITRVGAATKELQVEKIGKFGLGFNTVYRITDVPSVLSGSSMLIFDPNAIHLKKHIQSEANPGIKLNLQKHPDVLQSFADQFYPYDKVFDCDLKRTLDYNGTLIRLPFRTEEGAKCSKVCDQSFNEQQIQQLMATFQESSDHLLVFLKGVQNVTMSFLPSKSPSPDKQILRLNVCREQVHRKNIPEDFLLQRKQQSVMRAVAGENVIDVKSFTIIKVSMTQNSTTHSKHYFLHSSFGIGDSFQTFKNTQQKKTRFPLPVAGVALPVMKNTDTGKWRPDLQDFVGQVFCFLPLPIFSGLPFHLNGSFSVTSNRKSLWDATEKGEWNKKLLGDAVLVTWARVLGQLQRLCEDGDLEEYSYHTFWPDIRRTKSVFTEALKAFYRAVAYGLDSELLPVFSNGQTWCSIKHACFLSSEIVENKQVGEAATKTFSAMLPTPFVAVHLPQWVKEGFQASDCEPALLQNTYNLERFYKEIVFNNLDSIAAEERDVLINHAIDINNKEVDKLLGSVPCIPSMPDGKLQLISNLVHRQYKAATLFEIDDGCFPQGTPDTYLKPDRLYRLAFLGMLKDNIPIGRLMERSRTIATLWNIDKRKACSRVSCVLELLKDLIDQPINNTDQAKFRNISFLPAVYPVCSNDQAVNVLLKKPTDIFHYKHFSLVNMSEPVLSKEHIHQELSISSEIVDFLGLNRAPSLQTVMLQLEKAQMKSKVLPIQELTQTFRKCYLYLNNMIATNMEEIRSRANTFPFVLIGQECVHLTSVAHNISFDAAPYLYQLPKEYNVFDNLWKCLGLHECFETKHYMAVLESMAKSLNGKVVPKKDMKLVLRILNTVEQEAADDETFSQYDAQGTFLPDQNCVLRSADKLYFNDTPWLPCDKDTMFCHKMIPRPVALRFRILTKIHQTLQNLKVCDLSHWMSQFGAKEDLTRRIQNIISEYSSKKDILKELVQNADDCGATELHFVWDRRTHPSKRIFGDEWKSVQGPSLCIYNNKRFTNEDIAGIQQLGKGGKEDKLDKTGKYGLGFNAVYHLTDCPCFVTGDSMLCVFDPNLLFLPTSHANSPGGMFTVNQSFKETFPDVYTTFLPHLFELEKGTLFRLPLRAAETVSLSQISKQTVSDDDIVELWQALERDADSLLLFLNNLKLITFSEISAKSNQLVNIVSVEAKLTNRCASQRLSFQDVLHQCAEEDTHVVENMPYQVFYGMQVNCSRSASSTNWVLARQLGVHGEDKIADINRVCKTMSHTLLPHGAVAACINHHIPGRAFCSLPLPVETGLPVHINGNFIVDSARRDICKEDGGSAKTEWNSLLLTHLLAPLYCDLLKQVWAMLTQNKDESLQFVHMKGCENVLSPKYLRYFPIVSEDVSPLWQKLVIQVYRAIRDKQYTLLPVFLWDSIQIHRHISKQLRVSWAAVSQGIITDSPHFIIDDLHTDVEHVLQNINMKLVLPFDSLRKIFTEFQKAEVEVLWVSPQTVCKFLKMQRLHREGHALPCPLSETLLRNDSSCCSLLNFCINAGRKKNVACLNGVPLLVTKEGNLQEFSKSFPKYYSHYCDLFPMQYHNFANTKALSVEHTNVLMTMGLLAEFTIPASADYIKEKLGLSYQVSGGKSGDLIELPENIKEWFHWLWQFFKSQICKHRDEESCKRFQEFFNLFSDWAIVPVNLNNESGHLFLVSLGSLSNVMYNVSSDVDQIIQKLGFPVLNSAMIAHEIRSDHMQKLLLQTNDCCSVIQQLCLTPNLKWSKLDMWEMDRLLKHFIDGLSCVKNKINYLHNLQSVPLFRTMQQNRVCLISYRNKYILETKLSETSDVFKDFYQLDAHTVFLCNNDYNKQLAEHIDITVLNDMDFFIKFVLPHVTHLHETDLLKLLLLLVCIKRSDPMQYHKNKDTIVAALQTVKFIRDMGGKLQPASFFYDKEVPIFKTLGLHSRFIPEQFLEFFGFTDSEVLCLLRDLGMKHEISEEDFIMFAREVERDAKSGISISKLKPKINVLFRHLLSMNESKLTDNFVNRISCTAFLVSLKVKDELESLHPSFSKYSQLISLKDSLVKQQDEDVELLWTSVAILPTDGSLSKQQIKLLDRFGVVCIPPTHLVLENMKNVCNAPCQTPEIVSTRSVVLQRMYTFFQKNLDFEVETLMDLPCVLVENNSVAEPNQVVFNLNYWDELQPYLFKLPPLLACYSLFFQKIGVLPEPTLCHYAKVLTVIHNETVEKESLHPNLKKTIMKATQQFFRLFKEEEKTDLQNLKPLYLPATNGKLYESGTLVLVNKNISQKTNEILARTFKFIAPLNGSAVNFDLYNQEKLIQFLPETMRPRLLSQITKESLFGESLELCSLGENCEFKGHLQELLFSSHFQEGLACILRWQNEGNMSQEDAAKKCTVVFGKLQIICCNLFETILLYESKPLGGTNRNRQVFITNDCNGLCQVYLLHKDKIRESTRIKILGTLAEEINHILGNMLNSKCILILMEMLECNHPEDILQILNDHDVMTKNMNLHDAFNLPPPGEIIPKEWHDYLDMSLLNTFRTGEYVGYMDPTGVDLYLYAIIVELLPSKISGDAEVQMFRIDLGPQRIIDVTVLDLYQFKRSFTSRNKCQELVVVENLEEQKENQEKWFEKSLGDIKKELCDKLGEIWKLSKDERTKAVRRLYLKYHPDKNIGQEKLATEICKYLQQLIKDLEAGRPFNSHGSPNSQHKQSGGFANFWSQWDGEACHHRRHREEFTRKSNSDYDFWNFHRRHNSRQRDSKPKPEEAKRWYRQAKCDLKAAANDVGQDSSEWVLYKIHQAIEKALIAAHYMVQGHCDLDSPIMYLACRVSTFSHKLQEIKTKVNQLKSYGVDKQKTQYPCYHPAPGIPNESFPSDQEKAVLHLAQEVLDKIKEYIQP